MLRISKPTNVRGAALPHVMYSGVGKVGVRVQNLYESLEIIFKWGARIKKVED